jgi:DNA-binding NtrC family response regulator
MTKSRSLPAELEQSRPPSVLFIDDEAAIIATWAEIFRREGMDIGVANSAQDAIKKFREREWDVIVTDLQLGDDDGVSLLNEISSEAPVTISIVLTGFPTLPSAISAIRAGVHDYLIKPCKVQDMMASIKRGLSKREANRLRG